MDDAQLELERRSKFLNSLIQKKKANTQEGFNVRVRASDMPVALQSRAFRCARDQLDSMPGKKLDSKSLALALKKVRDHHHCGFKFTPLFCGPVVTLLLHIMRCW
ncbi:hypothetical protein LINPERPRIM_LOCUS23356 [Linum perenne]